jgi:hypothetical protein
LPESRQRPIGARERAALDLVAFAVRRDGGELAEFFGFVVRDGARAQRFRSIEILS